MQFIYRYIIESFFKIFQLTDFKCVEWNDR